MTVVVSLLAALSYGLSDFVGGVASRRVNAWTIAFVSQIGGGLAAFVLFLVVDGSPNIGDYAWAVLAGAGNGVGTAFLYRGLSSGRMGVVAPVSGVGAALLPVVVGVLTGDRPAATAWVGIVVALPAIYLVAREPDAGAGAASSVGSVRAGVVDGIIAGAGFGTLFAALGQIPDTAGFGPLAFNQLVGMFVVAAVAGSLGAPWVPRRPAASLGLVSGALGGAATGLFLIGTQTGNLAVAAVLTSLYPAFTVVLAAVLLRERIHSSQGGGLVLCALAVTLIALP